MDFDAETLHEDEVVDIPVLASRIRDDTTTWVDVQGLGDADQLRQIGETFSLHRLVLADVVNVPQRPKIDTHEQHILVVTRMVRFDDEGCLVNEQVAVVVGRGYVLTFQERYGDVWDRVRARIREPGRMIRTAGPVYLAYAILDAVIDAYYPVLESMGDSMQELEEEVLEEPTHDTLKRIYKLKREVLDLRRAIWPQREVFDTLARDPDLAIPDAVRIYLRDTSDHVAQLIDGVETYRELAGSLMDMYMSSVSNRMNEVMKTLTIMASIFIPITFIAGLYGMNFENMPELHMPYAYPMAISVMLATAAGMLLFFRRRGWL